MPQLSFPKINELGSKLFCFIQPVLIAAKCLTPPPPRTGVEKGSAEFSHILFFKTPSFMNSK